MKSNDDELDYARQVASGLRESLRALYQTPTSELDERSLALWNIQKAAIEGQLRDVELQISRLGAHKPQDDRALILEIARNLNISERDLAQAILVDEEVLKDNKNWRDTEPTVRRSLAYFQDYVKKVLKNAASTTIEFRNLIGDVPFADLRKMLTYSQLLRRVFEALFSTAPTLDSAPIATQLELMPVRFRRSNFSPSVDLESVVRYLEYLARIVERSRTIIPLSPLELREKLADILSAAPRSLTDILDICDELRLPLFPLRFPGHFYAACIRENYSNVLFIKQMNYSESRWMFDILHEIYHCTEAAQSANLDVIDIENLISTAVSDSELAANDFAARVLLGSDYRESLAEILKQAEFRTERIKSSLEAFAQRKSINTGVLANVMAYYLKSEQDVDWWGTAQNLQIFDKSIFGEVRSRLLLKIDLTTLDEPDFSAVSAALGESRGAF